MSEPKIVGAGTGDTVITVRNLDYPLKAWRVEGDEGEQMWPEPGTWTLAPEFLMRKGVKGVLGCPQCNTAALIPWGMGTLSNGANTLNQFQCQKCGLMCTARLLEWDTRKLFCIAYEKIVKVGGVDVVEPNSKGELVRKEYTHALTREEAFTCFVEVRRSYGRFRVVDVGLVIGFFGHEKDKDQTNLTTD